MDYKSVGKKSRKSVQSFGDLVIEIPDLETSLAASYL